jgi:hypothetical protein
MKVGIIVLIASTFLAAYQPEGHVRKVPLAQPFSIKMGEKVLVGDSRLKIRFLSVAEDSRCPQGVTCVWAGNAAVRVKIGKSDAVTLNTGIAPKELEIGDHKVKLVGLTPYPRENVKIDQASYEATLLVSKR